jgi:hypothetical protein
VYLGEPTLELVERQAPTLVMLAHLLGGCIAIGIRHERLEALSHLVEA